MGQDILAVADACGVDHFVIWGMSYGGKISRYLAVQSERVEKFIMMGTPMGMGVSGERRQQAEDFCALWSPIVTAQRNGEMDVSSLSQDDLDFVQNQNVPVMLGWVRAMLDWPLIEPGDFRCPTLWLIGSEDPYAMVTYKEYKEALKGSRVQFQIIEGLDHDQAFDEIDRVFSIMLDFTKS
jgi:pimeloyl-ACP methyl ester carboxylesterase